MKLMTIYDSIDMHINIRQAVVSQCVILNILGGKLHYNSEEHWLAKSLYAVLSLAYPDKARIDADQ